MLEEIKYPIKQASRNAKSSVKTVCEAEDLVSRNSRNNFRGKEKKVMPSITFKEMIWSTT